MHGDDATLPTENTCIEFKQGHSPGTYEASCSLKGVVYKGISNDLDVFCCRKRALAHSYIAQVEFGT